MYTLKMQHLLLTTRTVERKTDREGIVSEQAKERTNERANEQQRKEEEKKIGAK